MGADNDHHLAPGAILGEWIFRWGPLTPELSQRFLQRPEVTELSGYPAGIVVTAVKSHKKLADAVVEARTQAELVARSRERIATEFLGARETGPPATTTPQWTELATRVCPACEFVEEACQCG